MNKRLISLLLAALMLITLTACRSRKQEAAEVSEAYTPSTVEPEPPAPTPTLKPIPGTGANDFEEADFIISMDESESLNTAPAVNTNPPDSSDGTRSTPAPTAAPSEPDTPDEPDVTAPPAAPVTEYEAYNAMSAEEQMAFYETFDSMADFVAWYNSVQAEHEATHGAIEVGDGNIDLSEIIHGQP